MRNHNDTNFAGKGIGGYPNFARYRAIRERRATKRACRLAANAQRHTLDRIALMMEAQASLAALDRELAQPLRDALRGTPHLGNGNDLAEAFRGVGRGAI
jgi:hypothetical protein